jgi:hypothetical protein
MEQPEKSVLLLVAGTQGMLQTAVADDDGLPESLGKHSLPSWPE